MGYETVKELFGVDEQVVKRCIRKSRQSDKNKKVYYHN